MIKLEVPFYSQYSDNIPAEWRPYSCAISCLKMAIDFLNQTDISAEELIKEGIEIGAYSGEVIGVKDGPGWIHSGLVRLIHNHWLMAYSEEFRSRDSDFENVLLEKAIGKIRNEIESGNPVIVSCSKNWDEVHKFHQVLIIGVDENGFYYHEPNATSAEHGANRFVDLATFCSRWRKFAIFVSK